MTDALCLFFFLATITLSHSARILGIFPTPSISHQVVFRPLTQELAKRGHELVIVTTDPAFKDGNRPNNITEIDMHDLSYKIWRDHFLTQSAGNKEDLLNQIKVIFELMNTIMEKQFLSDEVQDLLKGKHKFDLLLLEAYPRQLLVFTHLFKAPAIQISSFGSAFWNYKAFGSPTHELLYPTNVRQKLYNLTLFEKITELYGYYKINSVFESLEDDEYKMVKRVFGNDVPTFNELTNNLDMLFLNIHPIWEDVRSVPPSVVHINGIHEKPKKELPKDLKEYLDSSKKGVIYISFGTNVKPTLLPQERMQIFTKVFSSLPYDVLWKWDNEDLPGKPKNVRVSTWLPQSDLLRHPKVKLFITQGGLQSTDETINAGVPVIGVPMLGDQWYNVDKYVYHKIGLRLDLETLTEDKLRDAIVNIVEDDSYRQNVVRLRTLMRDEYQSPLERAVWWAEYVIRHGGAKHLRSPAANISWAQYLELELVFTLLAGVLITITILIVAIKKVLRFICGGDTKIKKQ